MNNEIIGRSLISVFLVGKFFIIPLLIGLIRFIKIFTVKNTIKKAGANYFKNDARKPSKVLIYLIIGLVLILTFLMILGNTIVPIICSSFIIWWIADIIMDKFYGNLDGIYENGFIDDRTLIYWNQIHSYEINDNNLSGYYKDGGLFEYKKMENINEIKQLFENNNVEKRI